MPSSALTRELRELHQLANQLFVIQGFTTLVSEDVAADDRVVGYVAEIDAAAERATASVRRLQALALAGADPPGSAVAEREHEEVGGSAGEEQRVDPVEDAAVPAEEPARVLDFEI